VLVLNRIQKIKIGIVFDVGLSSEYGVLLNKNYNYIKNNYLLQSYSYYLIIIANAASFQAIHFIKFIYIYFSKSFYFYKLLQIRHSQYIIHHIPYIMDRC